MEIYYSIRIFEIPIFACLENVLRFAAVQMMLARTHSGGGKEEATYGTEAEPPPDNLSEAVRPFLFAPRPRPSSASVRPRQSRDREEEEEGTADGARSLAPFREANFVRGGNTSSLLSSVFLLYCCAVIGYPLQLQARAPYVSCLLSTS